MGQCKRVGEYFQSSVLAKPTSPVAGALQTGHMLSTACGSPHYVAPEILNFNGEARYDGRESDVWSLGVILHVLLIYKLPFEAESTQLLYKKIRQGLPSLPEHISPTSEELLRGMLEVVPDKRMTLVQAWVCARTTPLLAVLGKAHVTSVIAWLLAGGATQVAADGQNGAAAITVGGRGGGHPAELASGW